MGARVPIDHALRVIDWVIALRTRGEVIEDGTLRYLWKRNGHTMRVGHYHVDRVWESGDIDAGCHKFKYEELLNIKQLILTWKKENESQSECIASTSSQPSSVNA